MRSLLAGHMPVSKELPYEWYNTPNVHHCTMVDFEALRLARSAGERAIKRRPVGEPDYSKLSYCTCPAGIASLFAIARAASIRRPGPQT